MALFAVFLQSHAKLWWWHKESSVLWDCKIDRTWQPKRPYYNGLKLTVTSNDVHILLNSLGECGILFTLRSYYHIHLTFLVLRNVRINTTKIALQCYAVTPDVDQHFILWFNLNVYGYTQSMTSSTLSLVQNRISIHACCNLLEMQILTKIKLFQS